MSQSGRKKQQVGSYWYKHSRNVYRMYKSNRRIETYLGCLIQKRDISITCVFNSLDCSNDFSLTCFSSKFSLSNMAATLIPLAWLVDGMGTASATSVPSVPKRCSYNKSIRNCLG